MTSAPAGWYPDASASPSTPGFRWWDGASWTAHTAPAAIPSATVPTTPDGVPVAGFGRRLGAYVIDSLVTSVVGVLAISWILVSLWQSTIDLFDAIDSDTGQLPAGTTFSTFYPDFWKQLVIATAITFGITLAYHVFFLRLWGATPGKRFLRLTVRPWEDGDRLSWPMALKRAGMQYGVFAVLSAVYLNLLDGLWPLWDERRQALHDKVAGTVVVDVTSDSVSQADAQW